MPPRAPHLPGPPGQAAANQLNPQQLAQLHEYIRQKRHASGGGEVTASMVNDWMRQQSLPGAQSFAQAAQGLDPGQQQQLLIAQRQHILQQQQAAHIAQQQAFQPQGGQPPPHNQLILHLFPPHLASSPNQALAHLQAILFPPQNQGQQTAQNPLLAQVLNLAQAQRLSPEMMALLRTAVASRNPAQPQPQAHAPNPQLQQYTPQQPAAMQGVPAPSAGGSEAQSLVGTLQKRVVSLEALLQRLDIPGETRAKAQAELKASQAQLQNVVKSFLAHHPQATGAAADLQQAQRVAMAQRELEIQRRASGNNPAANQQQINAAYRTGSPANLQNPQLRQPPSSVGSPAVAPSPADSSKNGAGANSKKLPAVGPGGTQQQAGIVAQPQTASLGASQALAQAQQQASVMATQGGPPTTSVAALIPSQLSMPPAEPESFPAPRPTLNSGLANSPAVSTPAITKHPGFGAQHIADTLARAKDVGKPADKVRDDAGSKGRAVQKRKIRELVESVDPDETLTDEVEELMLSIADEFIDSMTRFACQLAKHRKSDRLEVKDLALHLDRSYGIRVPGFGPEDTRTSQTRRTNLPPGYQGRLAAVREARGR